MSSIQAHNAAYLLEQEIIQARDAIGDLRKFVKLAWNIIEPGTPYVHGWHIDAICEHLMAVTNGQIKELLINVPPRHAKPCYNGSMILHKTLGRIELNNVSVGDEILTHNGRFRKVLAVHKQGILPLLEITTHSGRIIKLAFDHPLLTPNGWKEAKNISNNDVLAIVQPAENHGIKTISLEESRFIGYLIGDGHLTKNTISFTNADDITLSDFIFCAKELGFRTRLKKPPPSWLNKNPKASIVVVLPICPNGALRWQKYMGKNPLKEFLIKHELLEKNSYNKRVPQAILSGNKEIISNYLGAYWACDGSIGKRATKFLRKESKKKDATREDIRCCAVTVCKGLAFDHQHLFNRIGISSRVRTKVAQLKTRKQGDLYYSYSIDLGTQDQIAKFSSLIPIYHSKIKNLIDYNRSDFDKILVADKVVSIKEIEADECICLTVEEDASFTIEDIAVHNSSIVSVIWPVWEWLTHPHIKWLFSSYAQSLSTRDSLKSRRLIQSPWFQYHYRDKFKLMKDQNKKMRYDNNKAGYRIATSVDGSNTGEGGDRIVCLPYNTKISCRYNKIEIGRIVENMMPIQVYSYHNIKKKIELKNIENFFVTNATEIIVILLTNGNKLECTPNHLIYVGNRGYVKAENITNLDLLMDENKIFIPVAQVRREEKNIKTYNIQVEGNRNYFANGLLVHNCDDANNAAEGESKAVLESTASWWKEVMSTRKNDPVNSSRVVIGQRVSSLDISQVFLDTANPVHLCLPAEYEGNKSVTVLGWSDPRTEMGELLWPKRFTKSVLNDLKKELGMYGVAAQLQQRPAPREGGIIKKHWFQFYKLQRDMTGRITNKFQFILQSWDTAFKEGQENDFSVCLTIGILPTGFYAINRLKVKVDFPELEKLTIDMANIYNPNQILIEDKASGQSLIQSIKKGTRLPIKAVKVDRDKTARLYAVSPIIEASRYFLPEGEEWVNDYIENMVTFPTAKHDDDVDATTQALIELGIKKSDSVNSRQIGSLLGR